MDGPLSIRLHLFPNAILGQQSASLVLYHLPDQVSGSVTYISVRGDTKIFTPILNLEPSLSRSLGSKRWVTY